MNSSWLELSTDFSRSCCQATSGIGGFFLWWSPVCHSQSRSKDAAFLVKMLGCSPHTTSYTVLCVQLLKFALPGKWPVCCIGSNITSLCGVVRLATCLRGWINSFWFPFSFVTVFVVDVVIIVGFVVWDRVIGVTVSISRNILSIFSLFSLFFQQSTLIPVMSWFFYSSGPLVWVCQH